MAETTSERKISLGNTLTLFGVFLALVTAIVIIGYRYYQNQKAQIIREKYQELAAIADLKAGQIARWRADRLADDLLYLQNPAFALSVERFLAQPDYSPNLNEVGRWLSPITGNRRYHSVVIFDADMKERLNIGSDRTSAGKTTRDIAVRAMRSGDRIVSDLHYGVYVTPIHLDVLIPLALRGRGGMKTIGAALVRVDPFNELYPLIQTWPTPSRTAETMLTRKDGEHVLFLNELRHRKGTALSLRLPLARTDLPAARAALGFLGNSRGVDYRGVPVFSVARKIPDSSWFLVAKIDEEEILAPVLARAQSTGVVVSILVLLAGTVVSLVWRHWSARLYKRLYEEELLHHSLEEHVRLNEARLQSLYNVSQYRAKSVQDLLDFALAEALSLTESRYGYIYFYDDEKRRLTLNSWSRDVMGECMVVEPQTVFDLDNTGIWGEAVRQGRPITVNDFNAYNPLKRGYPAGHVELTSFMTIPVFSEDRIVAVVGVANKDGDYEENDVRQLTMMMDSVWKYVERKRIEEDLIALNIELESRILERTEELESFTYSVSHDLRAPLRAIRGYSDILLREHADRLDGEGGRLLKTVMENSERMGRLIDDLLSFSRVGRADFERSLIDMTRLASDVRDDLLTSEACKDIECRVSPLPDAVGDCAMIRQVWVNLLSNAVKFTLPKKGGTVEVSGSSNNSEIIYTVRDTGVGFDMEYAHKLFGIFQRLHSFTEFEGTGVGLAIVQRIISRHGGRVWAEGKVGEGAVFRFTLPVSSGNRLSGTQP